MLCISVVLVLQLNLPVVLDSVLVFTGLRLISLAHDHLQLHKFCTSLSTKTA